MFSNFWNNLIIFHSIWGLRVYLSSNVGKLVKEITFAKCLKYKDQYILTYRQHTKVMGTFNTPTHLCQLKFLKAFCVDSILNSIYLYILSAYCMPDSTVKLIHSYKNLFEQKQQRRQN